MEKQCLFNTQTTGDIFNDVIGIVQVTIDDHAGGIWTVQRKGPRSDNWIDLDVTFVDNGAKVFYVAPGVNYRIDGGTAGATGYYIEVPLRVIEEPNRNVRDRSRGVTLQQ